MVQALLDGLSFIEFTREGSCSAFAARFMMRELKGVRGWVFYERYAALGGDPTYIRGQLHVLRVVPGEFHPYPNSREMVANLNDEDPNRLRKVPPAGDGDGGDGGGGGGGVDSAPVSRDLPISEQPVPKGSQKSVGPTTKGLQRPIGPEVSLGAVPKVEGEVGGIFSERSWATVNFMCDEFGQTPCCCCVPIQCRSPIEKDGRC